jgi:hypothetical protein
MATAKIPTFSEMSPEYQADVQEKLSMMRQLSLEIHRDLCQIMFREGYTISTTFREKGIQRIIDKDVLDYVGVNALCTQVKDILAGRLCPVTSDKTKSDNEVKNNMVDIIHKFYHRHPTIKTRIDNKTLSRVKMNVRYVVFNEHIELQVLTLGEYLKLEETHEEYERWRAGAQVSQYYSLSIV